MYKRIAVSRALIFVLVFSSPVFSQAKSNSAKKAGSAVAAAPSASKAVLTKADDGLPVKRVVLYKNGVGYFEHSGRVNGNQELSIDFTTAQLNDVLKSLTVVDLGDGHINGVRYNSTAPLSQRLRSLRLPMDEEPTVAGLLGAMKGSHIEVRSGAASASGRLLSVEQVQRATAPDKTPLNVEVISLVSDSGEVRTFDLTPSTSVRITEHDLNQEVGRYLTLLSSTRERDLRRMTISTSGSGERNIFVSYISEVPVWKSTYRIILPTKPNAKPLLQGWAIVDNTVGEDWKDVQLSLVAGAPQSFVQQISQPYYIERPVVPLPEAVLLEPQSHEGTQEANAGPPSPAPAAGAVGSGSGGGVGSGMGRGLGPGSGGGKAGGTYRVGGGVQTANGATGFTYGSAGKSVNGQRVRSNALELVTVNGAPSSLEDRIEAGASEANFQDLGDLFEYKLKDRVTIGKNQSALVPIVSAHIEAEKVTLWNGNMMRPLRALWVTNSSGLTLDGGPFNVLDENTFAGEGLMDPIKPNEKRLLSFAVDQGIRVESMRGNQKQTVTRVRIAKGVMTQTLQQREHNTYSIRNEDTEARTVVVEHLARPGWKIAGDTKPEETSASFHRFRLKVEPKTTAKLEIDESSPLESKVYLTNINDEQIKLFLEQRSIKPELEKDLRAIVGKKNELSVIEQEIQKRQRSHDEIVQDQQRLRENMKALKGSTEERALLQRYTKQLNDQEDQVAVLRKEIESLSKDMEAGRKQLNEMIWAISVDDAL